MANSTIHANNITIITKLTSCFPPINRTQLLQDLYQLYRTSPATLSNVFLNVSIPTIECNSVYSKYLEQILTFTNSVSIHIQVAFAALYYDYIVASNYYFHGLYIGREGVFNLSSISMNNTAKYDACASGEAALDPLCVRNFSSRICVEPFPNPWLYACMQMTTTSTPSLPTTTIGLERTTTNFPTLNSWQIGLITGLGSIVFLLLLILFIYGIRRRSDKTRVVHLNDNVSHKEKSSLRSGTPKVRAIQKWKTISPVRRTVPTLISPIKEGATATGSNVVSCINIKPPGLPQRGAFVDHQKVHDSMYPSKSPSPEVPPVKPTQPSTVVSRPVSGTSTDQLRSILDGLEEHTLDESDSISIDRSNSSNPKKPNTPVSRQFVNGSFVEESLHDEDAWMPILAVANDQLDVLNRLETVRTRIKSLV